ncbi:hypothetical protein FHL15_009373 [Xylaria flabelliformis]|uniref:Aflatoxin regulatory protein domain-containing protein n=1 Tax=Xylaria flabelliformis TaxID=2512241 RepID=A0A553HP99_9PEZI|nr:hypothetical protein FHL15_009373 [Xylaria flabelliformis]
MPVTTSPLIPAIASLSPANPLLVSPSVPLMVGQGRDSLLDYEQQEVDEASTLPSSWLPEDGFGAGLDVGLYSSWNMANLSPPSLEPDIIPALEPSHHIPTSVEGQSPTVVTTSTHDCEAQAISILRSMQHGEMYEGATSCSSNPILYAKLNLRPSFDRVLATNKAALNGCARLMKCSCALCPHIILLHVSILSKMLFWYRIAAAEKKKSSSESAKSRIDAHTASHFPGEDPPSPGKFSVSPTGIRIGILDLDAEDEYDLRLVLLLRDLRKTENVIDELMNVDRTALDESGDDILKSSVQWSLGGIARVKEELQDLIKKINQAR